MLIIYIKIKSKSIVKISTILIVRIEKKCLRISIGSVLRKRHLINIK